jgi:hypothetical protein
VVQNSILLLLIGRLNGKLVRHLLLIGCLGIFFLLMAQLPEPVVLALLVRFHEYTYINLGRR